MYTDESIMPNGKYKMWRLKDIPAAYFVRIWESSKGGSEPLMRKYITENIERIKAKDQQNEPLVPFVPLLCPKETYPTKKDAQIRLNQIKESPGDHKKPIRTYECPKCSGWHLTSEPIEEYKAKQL